MSDFIGKNRGKPLEIVVGIEFTAFSINYARMIILFFLSVVSAIGNDAYRNVTIIIYNSSYIVRKIKCTRKEDVLFGIVASPND
jgi:hypothetical protein